MTATRRSSSATATALSRPSVPDLAFSLATRVFAAAFGCSFRCDPLRLEPGGGLAHRRGERLDVGGGARKNLDRQRATVGAGEEADDDLAFARLAIPVGAEHGDGVVLAFQVRVGDVVEEDVGRRARLSAGEQPALDAGLIVRQPIEIAVEVVLVEPGHAERRADRMAAREPHRRQAQTLVEHARDDLPQRQLALPIRAEGGDEADLVRRLRQNPNRPGRRPLPQLRPALDGGGEDARQIALVLQRQPDRLHLLRLAVGEIGERPMLDLAVLAIGLAQEAA